MGDLKSQLKQLKDQLRQVSNPGVSAIAPRIPPTSKAPVGAMAKSALAAPPMQAPKAQVSSGISPPQKEARKPVGIGTVVAPVNVRSGGQAAAPAVVFGVATKAPRSPAPVPVPENFAPIARKLGTRQRAFRLPEPWVAAGGNTQNQGAWRGAVDIVIGLDFGTSFTKAAVGFQDKIYPVSWEGVSAFKPEYLLPSEFTRFPDGKIYLGQHPHVGAELVQADLKLPFINSGAVAVEPMERASTFIALVLRYVRAWVFQHYGKQLGSARIRWQLNIGAPCNGLENKETELTYALLARSAWRRSLLTDTERVQDFAASEGETQQDLLDVGIKPEFVAQMAGYMQSPQKQRGLHALVDVGGGTLDIVTFNVHQREGEDNFPFLVPEVKPLGTHGLLQNRLLATGVHKTSVLIDELAPVPNVAEFASQAGVAPGQIHARDELFKAAVMNLVRRVFDLTKARRYRLAGAWDLGVRTFFTGGGSGVSLYDQALRGAKIPSTKPLNIIPLPAHPRLDRFHHDLKGYQRISVACGLAQDAWTLGRIVPASEVQDDLPIGFPRQQAQERPDRDELYPK